MIENVRNNFVENFTGHSKGLLRKVSEACS